MVFSSIVFLIYFLPIFLAIYFLADKKYKNAVILLGSILFYAWGAPKFIFVILGTTFRFSFSTMVRQNNQSNETKTHALFISNSEFRVAVLFQVL